MKIKISRLFAVAACLGVVGLGFQNCSRNGFSVAPQPDAAVFASTSACMGGTTDACIFAKNAVAQSGTAMSANRIGGFQNLGVSLEDRDSSGYLQNSDLIVTTSSTARATGNFRRYYDAGSSGLEQIIAYYQANQLRKWMIAKGSYAGANQGFKIIADSSFNGFVPSKKEIHLQRDGVKFPAALDASIVISLFAQAQIWAASGGASHTGTTTNTVTCTDSQSYSAPSSCCASASGCGSAIVSGASDYLASLMFLGGKTVIGDGWKNDPAGLSLCLTSRDPASQSALTASTAYGRCTSRAASGEIHVMGLVYASIWWEVRKSISNQSDFDKFFLRHLSQISGSDTFTTIKTKILNLDASEFASSYSALMTAEFARRGL